MKHFRVVFYALMMLWGKPRCPHQQRVREKEALSLPEKWRARWPHVLPNLWHLSTPRQQERWAPGTHKNLPSISWSLLKLMSIESVMPSNHLTLCYPFLLLPSIFPSIRVFSSELILPIRWLKYWSFSFSISSSNEYPGLISFRIK